jgi:competence protein ComEC
LQRGPVAALYEIAIVTVAATAATLPLIALHFQRISLVALPANLAVLPVFPLIMLTTAVTAAAGLAADWATLPCGWVAWLGLAYMVGVVRLLDAVPFASLEVRGFGMGHAVVAYAILGVASWSLVRDPPGHRYVGAVVLLSAIAYTAGPAVRPASASRRPLRCRCNRGRRPGCVPHLRLGSSPSTSVGDAIFIRTPAARAADRRPDGEVLQEALSDER